MVSLISCNIFCVANLEYYILPVCLSYLYHCVLSFSQLQVVVDSVVVHSSVSRTLICDLVSLSC